MFRDFPFKSKFAILDEIEKATDPFFNLKKHLKQKWQKERASPEICELFKQIFIVNPNQRISFEKLYSLEIFNKILDNKERIETKSIYQKLETTGTIKNSFQDALHYDSDSDSNSEEKQKQEGGGERGKGKSQDKGQNLTAENEDNEISMQA